MKLTNFYSQHSRDGRPVISFEVFPPKADTALATLYQHLEEFELLSPAFISVTYGAGGSTRSFTLEIAHHILQHRGFSAMAHLTTVGSSREEMRQILSVMKSKGIENIIALRGDPPQGMTNFQAVEGGFQVAAELVKFMREEFPGDFDIAVAGYPEGHPECPDKETDWDHLAEKVRQGADAVITQLFFDNEDFYRFRDGLHKRGLEVPISAGIMPVCNEKQIRRITQLCGSKIPAGLSKALSQEPEKAEEVGTDWAVKQIEDLVRQGVDGIHLYTMNRPKQTARILHAADLIRT